MREGLLGAIIEEDSEIEAEWRRSCGKVEEGGGTGGNDDTPMRCTCGIWIWSPESIYGRAFLSWIWKCRSELNPSDGFRLKCLFYIPMLDLFGTQHGDRHCPWSRACLMLMPSGVFGVTYCKEASYAGRQTVDVGRSESEEHCELKKPHFTALWECLGVLVRKST